MSDRTPTDGTDADDQSRIAAWLAEHPRALGVLFTVTTLAASAAPVVASDTGGTGGP